MEREQKMRRRPGRKRRESASIDVDVDVDETSQQAAKRVCYGNPRRAFPTHVKAALEKFFLANKYPNESESNSICEATGLTEKQVSG